MTNKAISECLNSEDADFSTFHNTDDFVSIHALELVFSQTIVTCYKDLFGLLDVEAALLTKDVDVFYVELSSPVKTNHFGKLVKFK